MIMNYLFITGHLRVSLQHSFVIALFLVLAWGKASAQQMKPDSICINKVWTDKNGENRLMVKVNALCNPEHPPFDGHPSKIEVQLTNDKNDTYAVYDEENYQSMMLLFYESDIVFFKIRGVNAVLIPFFYCCNSDPQQKVSYILLYDDKQYLFHLSFYSDENGICHRNDDLDLITQKIRPRKLRRFFKKEVETKYKDVTDFYSDFER